MQLAPLAALTWLAELELSGARVAAVPAPFVALPALTSLLMNGCGLAELPEGPYLAGKPGSHRQESLLHIHMHESTGVLLSFPLSQVKEQLSRRW